MEHKSEQHEGTVVAWHQKQGYGFVFNDVVNRRVFFHIRNWNHATDPVVGDEVRFELAPSRSPNKPSEAVNVTPSGSNIYAGVSALNGGGQ